MLNLGGPPIAKRSIWQVYRGRNLVHCENIKIWNKKGKLLRRRNEIREMQKQIGKYEIKLAIIHIQLIENEYTVLVIECTNLVDHDIIRGVGVFL